MIKLLDGITFEGTDITNDQYKNLLKYYEYDLDHSDTMSKLSAKLTDEKYEKECSEWEEEEASNNIYYNVPKQKKPDIENILKETKRFYEAGNIKNIMREASHDGRRIMAFISKFLEKGEDPVKLIAECMSQVGFDVQLEE